MAKKPKKTSKKKESYGLKLDVLKSHQEVLHRLDYFNQHLDKLWEHVSTTNERLQDLEIQMNLVSRFLTVLSIEKLGIKLKTLRKMLRKIEHEAIAESQIRDLEELYQKEFKQHHPHTSELEKKKETDSISQDEETEEE